MAPTKRETFSKQSPLVPVRKEESNAASDPVLLQHADPAHSMPQQHMRGVHGGEIPGALFAEPHSEEERVVEDESFGLSEFEDTFVPVCHRKERDACGQGANEKDRRDKDKEVYRKLLKRVGVDTDYDDAHTFKSDSSDEALFWG